jgi:nitrile hydratase
MLEEHHGHTHSHTHPHEPIREIEQLPEPVMRLLALGQSVGDTGLTVVEEGRLKSDELSAKGLTQGLSYFEKRFLAMRSVLADKGVISQEDVKTLGEQSFESGVGILTRLLLEKRIISQEALDRNYEKVKARTPMTGAKIIAKAWADPAFKAKLLQDAKGAIMEWNASLLEPNNGETMEAWNVTHLQALENTEKVRNVVVCTLCSCYPMGLLGQPPEWYTKDDYRQRVVKEPRAVLKEWGTEVGDNVEIRIYDSSADMRYLVVPTRPQGTERLSENALADLVTRDSLIGVGDPLASSRK